GLLREIAPRARHYLLTVTPILGATAAGAGGGAVIGEQVLFRIDDTDRAETGRPRMSDFLRESYATPWVRLGNNTNLGYRISARAREDLAADLGRQVAFAVDVLSGIGAGPTSGATAVVGMLAKPAATAIADRASQV